MCPSLRWKGSQPTCECLLDANEGGVETISSQEMEHYSGISQRAIPQRPLLLRRVRQARVGYSVPQLIECIERILHIDQEQPILLVGAGNLGAALVGYPNFRAHRFRIAAVFDNNFVKIGRPFGENGD